MNRTLEEVLRAYCADKQEQWDRCLSMAEFAINNAKSPTTGHLSSSIMGVIQRPQLNSLLLELRMLLPKILLPRCGA